MSAAQVLPRNVPPEVEQRLVSPHELRYAWGTMFGFAWLQRKLLFPSPLVELREHAALPADGERWWLETDEGRVEAWFLPARGVAAEHRSPLVLFAHGNGELIDDWPELLAPYRALGVGVLLPEYRSYGRSAGKPSEAVLVRDFCALLGRARGDARVDAQRIVYHGRSLGGAVACALALAEPPCALILESTFTSLFEMTRALHLPVPRFLLHDRFDSLSMLRAFSGPILVMHGAADGLIPVAHGRRLAEANQNSQLVVFEGAGHNDLPWTSEEYWRAVRSTLQRAWD